MAVYTKLTASDIEAFLTQYEVGGLVSFKGITEGIENSNYLLVAEHRGAPVHYILTIYEQRVQPEELPFFMGLTEWLADRGISCPRPVKGKDGRTIFTLKAKPAALIHFLEGRGSPHITPRHTELTGELIARMHLAAEGFPMTRRNALSVGGWQALFRRFRHEADGIAPGLEAEIEEELAFLEDNWPHDLPQGVIHADIFPDNVFFIDGNTDQPELSGIIDFYFACNDFWMYDLLICMNAWCFDSGHHFMSERAQALLAAYNRMRPVTEAEKAAMPVLARGASMRFLVTRCYDWLNRVDGALVNPKDPMEYVRKLRFHQQVRSAREYGIF